MREFLRTETGGAAVLLAAAVAALVWVNVEASSYDALWTTTLSIDDGRRTTHAAARPHHACEEGFMPPRAARQAGGRVVGSLITNAVPDSFQNPRLTALLQSLTS